MASEDNDKDRDLDENGGEGEGESDEPEASKSDEDAAPAKETKPAPVAAKQAAKVPPPPTAGLGKAVALFITVVGGLSLAMLLLGAERGGGGPAAPKWNEGQTVDVEITLVSTDRQDLACASGTEIKGLHCGFESQGKRWSKGDPADDKKTLRPYSTTNNINFFAAGVWAEPALAADKLPGSRFSVKCKFAVEGKMPRADVRWHEGEGWNNVTDWYAGAVSDCKIGTVQ
ncbi:MAG: hypothetical protein IPK82_21865 [Polyangiaceae bacterium]|nr:hypothetical protein [Polyangiaceae bacterium]